MITIDELRKLDTKPSYIGLGIIKCRFRNNRAYHFFSDRVPPIVIDNIHNHRFSFTSTVIKGTLKNYIYDVDGSDPDSTLQIEQGEKALGGKRDVLQTNINLVEICSFTTTLGESYYLDYNTYHCIELLTTKVVTLLTMKLPLAQAISQFITNTSSSYICPFSDPKAESECWELIEYTLAD